MNKQEFLAQLRKELSGLPQDELDERLIFYSEMIDDRIEEGLSTEEAVAAAGSVDEIVWQIVGEVPFTKIAKERIKTKRQLKAWEILLLALGSPIWLSLLIASFVVVLSLYVSWWAIVISLWSAFAAIAGCAFGCIVGGAGFAVSGFGLTGTAAIAAGLVCAGVAIFAFFGCKAITKGTAVCTKRIALRVKKRIVHKEEA